MKIKLTRSIFIFGLGITGISALKAIEAPKIYAWDESEESRNKAKNLTKKLGKKIEITQIENVQKLDILLVSPGVKINYPEPHSVIIHAKKRLNAKITNDIELFCNAVKDKSKIIAITGTNGKSTLTKMLYNIIKNANFTCQHGGNFGIPVLDFEENKDFYVLEISSYQLETLDTSKFHCSILLNISRSHIARHKTFENYINIKTRIFEKNDIASCNIINIDNEGSNEVFKKLKKDIEFVPFSKEKLLTNGVSYIDNKIYINTNKINAQIKCILNTDIENSIAAFAVSYVFCNIEENIIIETLKNYRPLEHRMEILDGKKIAFINDSKSTNIASAEYAINNLKKNFALYWILGGLYDDSITVESLKNLSKKAHYIFLIGSSSKKISSMLEELRVKNFAICEDLEKAMINSYKMASQSKKTEQKPAILLSPACPSFDQWDNFEHRGRVFKKLVKKLINT